MSKHESRLTCLNKSRMYQYPNTGVWVKVTLFRCACGNDKWIRKDYVIRNKVVSCGCISHNKIEKGDKKGSSLYELWRYANRKSRKDGTYFDEAWLKYEVFKEYAYDTQYEDGMRMFRIKLAKGYKPGNVVFVEIKESSERQKRSAYTAFGETKSIGEWLADNNCIVSKTTIYARLNEGWDFEKAISTPTQIFPKFSRLYHGTEKKAPATVGQM